MDGVTVTPKSPASSPEAGFNVDGVRPIAGLLGLDTGNLSDSDSKALQAISTFLRGDAAEMTDLEMLAKLRSLENRLGMTSLGERRLDKVHRYVELQSKIDNLEKQRDRELR